MNGQKNSGHDGAKRSSKFADRYRLYLDESGDHVFRETVEPTHRYLCLLGCWFHNPDYLIFHDSLEALKVRHFSHHPDDPVVFHREDMINARRVFKGLQDVEARRKFDDDLLKVIGDAKYKVVAVVIDKHTLREQYGEASAHP